MKARRTKRRWIHRQNKYSCDQIFLATDEQLLFENLNRKFKGIVSKNDTHLAPKSNNRSIHKVAVFQSDKIKFKLGSDVLTDAIIMSKCKYSLFMHRQVSYLSLMLREDFNFFFIDEKVDYSGLD